MDGNLSLTGLPAAIRALYAERKSGILHVLCPDDGVRRIFFREGRIVLVESDAAAERFGEDLVQAGRIQEAELKVALELAERERTGPGKALETMRRLSAQEAHEAELRHMNKIVYSLVASTSGLFRFQEGARLVENRPAYEISAAQVILDGVRHIADPGVLLSRVGNARASLRRAQSSALDLSQIKVTAAERGVLEALRSAQAPTIEQVVAGSGVGKFETIRAVYALISIGVVEAQETTAAGASDVTERGGTGATDASGQAESEPAPARPQNAADERRLGRFEIQRLLQQGSMGEVFRARDPETDRIVAIKLLRSTMELAPGAREVFMLEFKAGVEAAIQLHHPGLAAVWEMGVTNERCPFLVSEYVRGTTLHDLLPPSPLAPQHALELANQICDALAYAHGRGVVHGQIKPAVVLVMPDGRAKIKDFGLPQPASSATRVHNPYLSPEQLAKREIDVRTDVFSFGVVCFRMLTGTLPFPQSSLNREGGDDPLPPVPQDRFPAELSPLLRKIVLKCLAVDPANRFSDARELQRAMRSHSLAAPETNVAPTVPATPSVPTSRPATTETSVIDPRVASAAPAQRVPETVHAQANRPASISTEPPQSPRSTPPAPPASPAWNAPPAASAAPPIQSATTAQATATDTRGTLAESFRDLQKESNAPARVADDEVAAEPEPSVTADMESTGRRPAPAAPRRRSRGRIAAVVGAAVLAVVAIPVGAALVFLAREEPPWPTIPSPVRSDVSVTPTPYSSPSDEVLAALLAGPSDDRLFAEASFAFERNDLRGTRRALMELLERSPQFPGARELLAQIDRIEAERRAAAERRRRAREKKPEPVDARSAEERLFAEAESALARGALIDSKAKLDALLKVDPLFAGAVELLGVVEKTIWTTTLPKSFSARHNHRLGSCEGTMLLTVTGLSFGSSEHEWAWSYSELVSMNRPDEANFHIVTTDRDLMGLLKHKRFTFRLAELFSEEDWRFFRETVEGPIPGAQN